MVERYVAAYNDRDLEAMLSVVDEHVVSYPAPLFTHRRHYGHDGVRSWWAAMAADEYAYDVLVKEVWPVEPDRAVVFGELKSGGRRLGPWALMVQVTDGLIVESRSYLSYGGLLDALQRLQDQPTGRIPIA